jgi:CRISPR-associated protein Cas5h
MKVISFYLRGKMAHFRKFYSNSSALSYFIPPRTTICGILAGLLGLERDSYYGDFSIDNCQIALSVCKPLKKTMQKLNYLMIKSPNDLNGSQGHHSQTPLELVIPQNIRTQYVDYKIWVHHNNLEIMDKLEVLLGKENTSFFYKSNGACMGLGTAFNLGWIDFEGIFEIEENQTSSEQLISSAIPVQKIEEIKIENIINQQCKLIKEELPLEFDRNRCITERGLKEVLVNIESMYTPVVVDSFVKISTGESICWLE